jgi:hypothetical protein
MAIPLFGCQAHGGKILSLDDRFVYRDGATLQGTGGVSYVPYFQSTRFRGPADSGHGKLRRIVQRVYKQSQCVVAVRLFRDGLDSGQSIPRALTVDVGPLVTFPTNVFGTEFQVRYEISSFDAEITLGSGEIWVVPYRRGGRR